MIDIHGLFPLFALTDGRSRNQAEREMRKLSHAMCCNWNQGNSPIEGTFERMTMTPIDIIWAADAPNAIPVRTRK